MAPRVSLGLSTLLVVAIVLLLLPCQVHAFGAGNIASISKVEGKNWRHGDIEDMLKTIAFLKGKKWTSNMVKRVYFGNWLRDYSQALDVGTLKNLPSEIIRILVWMLSFSAFGYATAEFEVTADRLGVYRPEEHIDNPKDYADNQDARQYDARLRGPIRQVELDIDPETGMKNYIGNEKGDWATSAAYVKYSLARSIHYGRLYTHGGHRKGNEEDLCEALRCLGQGLHTLEDFSAHTNYCELALREMGFNNVFPHTGSQTQMNIRGHHVYPLVTGTFGMVDFFHSVLGEATDHFTQSEINEMDIALGDAQSSSSANSLNSLSGLLAKVPGCGDLVAEAEALKRRSEAQESSNRYRSANIGYASREGTGGFGDSRGFNDLSRADAAPNSSKPPSTPSALQDFDPAKTIAQIYPILEFRDRVVRKVSSVIEKIPGLEAIVDKITETLTIFVMSLLSPFIRPLINAASQSLQAGSAGVIDASGKHQYEPWTNPHCTDPTHSMLSKDHFSNVLNEPAGHVASAILNYVTSRVLWAWEDINIPEQQVVHDCVQVFHHPALRDMRNEGHRAMFEAVQSWVSSMPDRGAKLNDILSSEGVRTGKNNSGQVGHSHSHAGGSAHAHGYGQTFASASQQHTSHSSQQQQQQQQQGSQLPWEKLSDQLNSLPIPGISNLNKLGGAFSSLGLGSSSKREASPSHGQTPPPEHRYEQQYQQEHHYQSNPAHDYGSSYGQTPPPPQPTYDTYGQLPPQQPYGYNQPSYNHPPQGYGHGTYSDDPHQQQQPPHEQHQHQHQYPPHGHGYGHGPGYQH